MAVLDNEIKREENLNIGLLSSLLGGPFQEDEKIPGNFSGHIKPGRGYIIAELLKAKIIEASGPVINNIDSEKLTEFVAKYIKKTRKFLVGMKSFASIETINSQDLKCTIIPGKHKEVLRQLSQNSIKDIKLKDDSSVVVVTMPLSEFSSDTILGNIKASKEKTKQLLKDDTFSSIQSKMCLDFLREFLYLPFDIQLLQPFPLHNEFDDAQNLWLFEELNWLQEQGLLMHSSSVEQDKEGALRFSFCINSIDELKISLLAEAFARKLSSPNEKIIEMNSVPRICSDFEKYQQIIKDMRRLCCISGWLSLSGNFLSAAMVESSEEYKETFKHLEDNGVTFRTVRVGGHGEDRRLRILLSTKNQPIQEVITPNLLEINFYLSILLSQRVGITIDEQPGIPTRMVFSTFVTEKQKTNLEKKLKYHSITFQRHGENGFLVSCHNISMLKKEVGARLQKSASFLAGLFANPVVYNMNEIPREFGESIETFRQLTQNKHCSLQIVPSLSYHHPFFCENLNKNEAKKLRSILNNLGEDYVEFYEHSFQTGFFGQTSIYKFEILIKNWSALLQLFNPKTSNVGVTSTTNFDTERFANYTVMK